MISGIILNVMFIRFVPRRLKNFLQMLISVSNDCLSKFLFNEVIVLEYDLEI